MRINSENKTMDMEARDINYILPAYLRSYQFHSKNELPERIIFPMFHSVKAANGVDIPIEYVPPLEPVAAEIAKDGASVPEITPTQEAELDKKDEEIKRLKAEVDSLQSVPPPLEALDEIETKEETATRRKKEADDAKADQPPAESPAKSAFIGAAKERIEKAMPHAKSAITIDPDPTHQPPPDRKPNQPPGGDIGPGQGPSDMHPRGSGDQITTQRDLLEEPEIDETKEKPFEQSIKRDEKGNPVVEDMTEQ